MFCVELSGVSKLALAPSQFEAANLRHFWTWIRSAAEEQRAEAALTLAWAYRYIGEPADLHGDLEPCVAALLDDPSPQVRRALAEGIADVPNAPSHIVIALADDRPDIAAAVLGRSLALTEMELARYALAGEECVQLAIARRADLSPVVAACLAEKAGPDVLAALVLELADRFAGGRPSSHRGACFGDNLPIRNAMLARTDLPALVRCDLIEAAMAARAAVLPVPISIRPASNAWSAPRWSVASFARPARAARRRFANSFVIFTARGLTVALLLRALASGETAFFEVAAADLSGLDEARVAAMVRDPNGTGFAALVRRAGLPSYCLALFRLALRALEGASFGSPGQVFRPVVTRLIDRCATEPEAAMGAVLVVLRRLEKEAALDEAREFAMNAASENLATPAEEQTPDIAAAPLAIKLLEQLNLLDTSPAPFAIAC